MPIHNIKKIKLKKILTSLTIILFSYLTSVAQNQPNEDEVHRAIEKIKVLHLEDNDISRHSVLSNDREIRYIIDQFTSIDREECLAIVPMEAGRHYVEWIIFMYKNAAGYWNYGKWYSNIQNTVDITDVDNDGIKEIITEGSGFAQGYLNETYRLLSIKNGKEEILYQNETFDNSAGHLIENSKTGDTISVTIEVKFIEFNNMGVKGLEEKMAVGIFESYNETNGVQQSYQKKTNSYLLHNGIYVRKE
mgnify:CR=1 FL=1